MKKMPKCLIFFVLFFVFVSAVGAVAGEEDVAIVDFNDDGSHDIALFYPDSGKWYIKDQSTPTYGTTDCLPVPGDYDGDGATDLAIMDCTRPDGMAKWYLDGIGVFIYGLQEWIPVPGDYDGDGITDTALFDSVSGKWYVRGQFVTTYGAGGIPVPGDYDGDGITDIAVFNPANNKWYIKDIGIFTYGMSDCIPVPADYDGDGVTDLAVIDTSRPDGMAKWYIRNQSVFIYGSVTDTIAVPGDYDGDGDDDPCLFYRNFGKWYIRGGAIITYGSSDMIPLAGNLATRYAISQTTRHPEPCGEPCKEGEAWEYGLNLTLSQCSYSQNAPPCSCPLFDYESSLGYAAVPIHDVEGVVLKLCDCENAMLFSTESSYGIRLEILAPSSGVYFTNQNYSSNNYDTCTNEFPCDSGDGYIYVSSYPDPVSLIPGQMYSPVPCEANPYAFTFEPILLNQSLYDPSLYGYEDCCFACNGAVWRVKAIQTSCKFPFMKANKPYLLIDMPTFVYDPLEVVKGTMVYVKVTVISEGTFIDEELCSCIILVGIFNKDRIY